MYPAPREPHSAGFSCASAEAPQKNARPSKDSTNLNFTKPPGIELFLRAQKPAWARSAEKPIITIRDGVEGQDRKSTRLNSSHQIISYAVFCLKKKKILN